MRTSLQSLRWVVLASILCILVLAGGCRKRAGGEVWAEVDGQPIYRDQVERYYRSRMAGSAEGVSAQQALSLKLNILNELVNNEILLAHAARSQITVSEAEVDTQVAKLQTPYSKDEFRQKLASQGLELADFRQQVRESLIIDKLINKEITARLAVTDAEISSYYERSKAEFSVPETEYHVAQIEVTSSADSQVHNLKNDDAKTEAAADRKIQALYARLKSGDDFATVAQEYSEDPKTASGGGDMGFFPASSLDSKPQLKRVVTSLKVGEFSGVIRMDSGYHIVKLLGREEPGQRPLSDPQVQAAIRRMLMSEKEELLKTAYIEVLRDRAKVVNHLAQQIVGSGAEALKPQ